MKGIVFTEFLDLVENSYGLEVVDKIITNSKLNSKGAYTAVGTYNFSEMLQLLTHLSAYTGIEIDKLLYTYGEHFFSVLLKNYPTLIQNYQDPIDLLSSVENHIHIEVKKIYPGAELPTFKILNKTQTALIMEYSSSRAMHHFGLGLMNKTFEHFNAKATINIEKIEENGTKVKFTINKIT